VDWYRRKDAGRGEIAITNPRATGADLQCPTEGREKFAPSTNQDDLLGVSPERKKGEEGNPDAVWFM